MARVLPVGGSVSSRFLGGYRSEGGHSGTDYAVPMGTPIASAAGGTVISAGWAGAYGYRVEVRHGDGTVTTYSHLSDINVSVGQQVGAGQRVGAVGSTGNSKGPHLHFEVLIDGNFINPEDWLAGAAATTPTGGATASGAMNVERVGTRITPVQADDAWASPTQVDIVAADSRFGYAANESRFGMAAEESRSVNAAMMGLIEEEGEEGDLEAPIQWESTTASGASGPIGANDAQIIQRSYDLIRAAGGTDAEARFLASVVIPESGGNPNAVNQTSVGGSRAHGLWQIMFPLHQGRAGVNAVEELFNPNLNAKVALDIYRDQGPGAWEVTLLDGGRHKPYLL